MVRVDKCTVVESEGLIREEGSGCCRCCDAAARRTGCRIVDGKGGVCLIMEEEDC